MLNKDPDTRITIPEMMDHNFVTNGGIEPMGDPIAGETELEITENDLKSAITKMAIDTSMFVMAKMKTKMVKAKRSIGQNQFRSSLMKSVFGG